MPANGILGAWTTVWLTLGGTSDSFLNTMSWSTWDQQINMSLPVRKGWLLFELAVHAPSTPEHVGSSRFGLQRENKVGAFAPERKSRWSYQYHIDLTRKQWAFAPKSDWVNHSWELKPAAFQRVFKCQSHNIWQQKQVARAEVVVPQISDMLITWLGAPTTLHTTSNGPLHSPVAPKNEV